MLGFGVRTFFLILSWFYVGSYAIWRGSFGRSRSDILILVFPAGRSGKRVSVRGRLGYPRVVGGYLPWCGLVIGG